MSVSDSASDLRGITRNEEKGDRREEFEPVTYTFRIPEKGKKGVSGVLSPPEWLLLDHTIAVVWSLFSTCLSANLDIEDLKWAHEFLKEVRNNRGENPPDVKTCLTEIQNRLISLYAQLTHKEDKSMEEKPKNVAEPSKEVKEEPKPEKDPVKRTSNPARKPVIPLKEQRKAYQAQSKRESAASSKHTPPKKVDPPRKVTCKKKEEFLTEVFQRNKPTDPVHSTPATTKKKSNQVESGALSKDPAETKPPAEDGKISLQFKKWITEEDINNGEQAYRNLKNEIRSLMKNPKISKDEVLKFLSNWREEQVERIESELKRLNSIEEFMISLKVDGFVPYLQDERSQRLEVMSVNKKLKKPS